MSESSLFSNNVPEFKVSEISRAIKRVIEDGFGYVKIIGEVSGFKQAASGHCYFSLKDEGALISAVCFRGVASQINFTIEDGLEIAVFGKVTTYEGRSNYQIIVQKAQIAGQGAILEMIEKRRKKLLAEGLFADEHKKTLPFWPNIIGVITSPTGAVIEDIIHRVSARFPTNIRLYPSSVQGQNAAMEVISGIKYFNSLEKNRPDVIIIARGGGSLEDLLPFNDEELVRLVFASKIPIISAIGHETDVTLIDYAADLRAPTPTAAAEIATPNLVDLKNLVLNLENRLNSYVKNNLETKERSLSNVAKNLIHPKKILEQNKEKIENLFKQLQFLIKNYLNQKEQNVKILGNSLIKPDQILNNFENKINSLTQNLENNFAFKINKIEGNLNLASKLLDSYHYKKVLKRGYAIVRNDKNQIISDINNIKNSEEVNVEINNGNFTSLVKKKHSSSNQ